MWAPLSKKRRRNNSDDENERYDGQPVYSIALGDDDDSEEEELSKQSKATREFPKSLAEALDTAYARIANQQAKSKTKELSSQDIPRTVFVVVHESVPPYGDTKVRVVGTFARVHAANEKVLDVFRNNYQHYFVEDVGEDAWVRTRPGRELKLAGDGVAWSVSNDATLRISPRDAGGDEEGVYQIYTVMQTVQV
ncbi:hypothetical protein BGW36DRAFT_459376 [Talaromyces proteolyticus]|uniref:Uncharacterized protein n=1 Tax=Talaromyces proteolyticus TaxID=1131652 RepID=A0AAD4KSK8_9EURO|nr:uncharacterized protein BGW36DRAFT_459376 [Talaromyces proteolyticus]KAH8700152.1 hypothetical protein BGW36DRAFT_459376 [Talaromyces proteolyticus]